MDRIIKRKNFPAPGKNGAEKANLLFREGQFMKKKIKGFTLVECIVAMTIFAIASLTIAQVYVTVNAIQKENEYMQYSLANQMKYVENDTQSQAVDIKLTTVYPSVAASGNAYTVYGGAGGTPMNNVVKMYKIYPGSNGTVEGFEGIVSAGDDTTLDPLTGRQTTYYVGVDMFVYKSRTGSSSTAGEDVTYDASGRAYTDESNTNLRYKFMKPR
jgi:prepilin-type N-terminal cleavage/methylation domain-containing protein